MDSAIEVDANDKHGQKESNWGPELDQVHKEVSSSEHLEEITTKENNQYSQEILKHVKVLNVINSRKSTAKDIFKNPGEEALDVDKDDRNKIEEQLKKAFAEFYQKLHSLKQYRYIECFKEDCKITICCYL